MTDRGHVDPNLMGPTGLEPASDEAYRTEGLLEPPMGRGVPSALPAHDRHFLPMAGIAPDRRHDLAGGRIEAAPDKRNIFALERAGAAMIGEEFGQAPMRRVGLGDDQNPGCVLVEPMDDTRPPDTADSG